MPKEKIKRKYNPTKLSHGTLLIVKDDITI